MDGREFFRRAGLVAVFGAVSATSLFEVVARLDQSKPASVLTSGGQAQAPQAPAGMLYVAPLSGLAGKTFA